MSHFLDIIIPEYDCKEEFIKRLLHSISRQKNVDFSEIGVIIVNDKSKNKLRKGIFKNYPKLNIEYYLKDVNEGVGMTRQYGLDKSTAKYVTFVDQDDELYGNESLYKLIAILKIYDYNYVSTDYIEEIKNSNGEICQCRITKTNPREVLHGVFLKREFLIQNNIHFKPGYRVHDDFYIRRIIKTIESPAYSELVTYVWKFNESSQVRRKRKYAYMVETFDEFFRATKEANEFMIETKRFDSFNITSSILGLYIILESNLFAYDELKEKKINFEKELYELIVKSNEPIELIRNSFDAIYQSQLNVIKKMEPTIVVNENFFDFIDRMKDICPDYIYKRIEFNRFLDIIVPYYDISDKKIESLMNTIINQKNITLSEIGVIFVSDDSPTDISDSILHGRYPFLHIEYIKKSINEGQGLTRQYGLDRSTAKYVTFVDQDDMLYGPDALSKTIAALKKYEPELLYTDYYRYDPTTGQRRIITYLELSCLHGTFFLREKLVEKQIKFSDKFRMYEDTYYMIVAGRLLDSKYLNIPTYIWKVNEKSQTAILNNENSVMIVEKFDDYILSNVEAAKFLIDKDYIDEDLCKGVLFLLLSLLNSNLFEGTDTSNYEKKLYDYYLYLKNIFEFKNENERIAAAIDRVKKDYVKTIDFSFDKFIKDMEEKYQ